MNEILAAARARPAALLGHPCGNGRTFAIANSSTAAAIDIPACHRARLDVHGLIAGRVDMARSSVALAVGQRVRVLAVRDSRQPAFPEAPTSPNSNAVMPPGFTDCSRQRARRAKSALCSSALASRRSRRNRFVDGGRSQPAHAY